MVQHRNSQSRGGSARGRQHQDQMSDDDRRHRYQSQTRGNDESEGWVGDPQFYPDRANYQSRNNYGQDSGYGQNSSRNNFGQRNYNYDRDEDYDNNSESYTSLPRVNRRGNSQAMSGSYSYNYGGFNRDDDGALYANNRSANRNYQDDDYDNDYASDRRNRDYGRRSNSRDYFRN